MRKDSWAHLEQEECDSCGVKPSRHMGHGRFICKKCYDDSWCPKCHHALGDPAKHVCVTPEAARKEDRWFKYFLLDGESKLIDTAVLLEELLEEAGAVIKNLDGLEITALLSRINEAVKPWKKDDDA